MSDTKESPFLTGDQLCKLVQQLTPVIDAVVDAINQPHARRKLLAAQLLRHLGLRRATLQGLLRTSVPGQGALAAAQFGAELARVAFVEAQVEHLDSPALLYSLGVFAVDGRPGDYVMPWTPTPTNPADRD